MEVTVGSGGYCVQTTFREILGSNAGWNRSSVSFDTLGPGFLFDRWSGKRCSSSSALTNDRPGVGG